MSFYSRLHMSYGGFRSSFLDGIPARLTPHKGANVVILPDHSNWDTVRVATIWTKVNGQNL